MTYYVTASDGTDIAYDCMGEGPPVVLIHGFGANRAITWGNTGWFQAMIRAAHGRVFQPRCVAFDGWYSSLENLKLLRGYGWEPDNYNDDA